MEDIFDLHAYLKNNPLLESDELKEMARIAQGLKLTSDYKEKMEGMPDRFKTSTRYQRVIKHLENNESSTLRQMAEDEFNTTDTAAVNQLVRDLVDYGVIEKTGYVTPPKSKEPKGDGTKGRPMSSAGYIKSALAKYREGDFDYTDKEREELTDFIKNLNASLKPKK
jgi:hypothetical protein